MVFHYYCKNCLQCVGCGENGKIIVEERKVLGACCFNMNEEIKIINEQRKEKGLREMHLMISFVKLQKDGMEKKK